MKYKSIINYLFFGVCTTAVNVISYQLCYVCSECAVNHYRMGVGAGCDIRICLEQVMGV